MRTLNKQTVHSNVYECVGEMRVNVTVVTFDKYKPKKKSKIWKTNPHNDYVAYAQIFNKWFFHSAFVMPLHATAMAHTQQYHVSTGLDRLSSYDSRRKRGTEIEKKRTATSTRWLILTKLFLKCSVWKSKKQTISNLKKKIRNLIWAVACRIKASQKDTIDGCFF